MRFLFGGGWKREWEGGGVNNGYKPCFEVKLHNCAADV